ncbi:MAG: hypothetical protein IJM99_11880, partial [Firmicutes bacterium]|nr:hypothetical protein [Bacillota bacterium]
SLSTQFLHYAVFNVRAPLDVELFYITKLKFICQQLFSSFFKTIFELGAVVSDSFYILPNLSFFVNYFFHLFSDFVVESSDSVVLFDTALSIYQTIPALSTGFLQILSFYFSAFQVSHW